MSDLKKLFREVDSLTQDELNQLYNYIKQRRRVTWWTVAAENLQKIAEVMRPVQEEAAQMPEEEINAVIDEAIAEVRCERKQNRQV